MLQWIYENSPWIFSGVGVVIVLAFIAAFRRVVLRWLTSLRSTNHVSLEVITNSNDLFEKGSKYLTANDRREVLVYAPTGVWFWDAKKYCWFKNIAGCLAKGRGLQNQAKANMTVSSTLGNYIGVYGLPHKLPQNDDEKKEIAESPPLQKKIGEELDTMENLFLPFDDLDTAHLRYLEVDTKTIPGTGVIVIDSSACICFAVTGRHKVNYGLFIRDREDVVSEVQKWFRDHIMNIAGQNIIQEVTRGITMTQGMDNLREAYGLPRKHSNQ